jgi:glutaredoxin 3
MKDITVYTSTSCTFCKALKQYLNEKDVNFTERNIDQDKEAVQYLIEHGHRGVPVTVIGDQEIVGFDKEKINAALGL